MYPLQQGKLCHGVDVRQDHIAGFGVVLLLAALAAVLQAPDRSDGKIVMGIPGPQYDELAKTYRRDLERHGVDLELRQSTEGFATFTILLDSTSGMQAALVKGGLFGSLQGRLASAKERDLHDKEMTGLRSIGRLFYEPLWVSTRGDLPIESLGTAYRSFGPSVEKLRRRTPLRYAAFPIHTVTNFRR